MPRDQGISAEGHVWSLPRLHSPGRASRQLRGQRSNPVREVPQRVQAATSEKSTGR